MLDAAIEVLGTSGMRHLTHRAVDEAADLPLGSTSNRFRTRHTLLVGVLGRILERETEAWNHLAVNTRLTSTEALAAAFGRLLEQQCDHGRVLTQARRAVFVEAVNVPALREEITRAQQKLTSWMAPLLAELGSSDPSSHVRHLLALMDGLMSIQLATDAADFDPSSPLAALLRGLVA